MGPIGGRRVPWGGGRGSSLPWWHWEGTGWGLGQLLVVELQIHAIVDLIVPKCDVVLEDGVPFLQHNFIPSGPGLRRNQFLEVTDGILCIAFHPHFFAQTVVANDFNHRYDAVAG